ncbi:MAG: barstar family protein [Pyrinomonadaceae bacterium]
MVHDWPSFHNYCKNVFGFFEGYGMNMDAWIDCMSSLDEGGMTKFLLGPNEMLHVEFTDTENFRKRVPEIFESFIDCSAFVNQRYAEMGRIPALSLLFVN